MNRSRSGIRPISALGGAGGGRPGPVAQRATAASRPPLALLDDALPARGGSRLEPLERLMDPWTAWSPTQGGCEARKPVRPTLPIYLPVEFLRSRDLGRFASVDPYGI